jgi:hypothetical protein
MSHKTYVDFLIQQWRMTEQSDTFQASVRRVLHELIGEALLELRTPKLQVATLPSFTTCVWAFFPVGVKRRRTHTWAYRMPKVRLESAAEVLLVFGSQEVQRRPKHFFEDRFRDHLGHTLIFLRDPEARNECSDAQEEWRRSSDY